jgi:ribosome-associated protein
MATVNQQHHEARILVQAAVQACEDKKGEDTRILELDPIDSGLSDFFLITSANNNRQTMAIADEIEHRLKKDFGIYPNSVEGRRQGEWILLDYVDFVVHVFLAERRAFYDIERLRKSARPLTPAEFDAELKATLAKKTVAVRKKASAKSAVKAVVAPKKAAKKAAKKSVVSGKAAVAPKKAAKKVAAKKAPAKKTPVKKAEPVKSVAKKTAKKAALKKTAVKKTPAKKATAKKSSGKKS